MATQETLDLFENTRALRAAAVTAGVQAHEQFYSVSQEQRMGDPVTEPNYLAARIALRESEVALDSLDYKTD